MSRVCPACGRPLPPMSLPVCASCGERLPLELQTAAPPPTTIRPSAGLPLVGDETRAELIDRFFGQPVTYALTPGRFAAYLLAPWLLPAATLIFGSPPALTAVLLAAAAGLSLLSAVGRRPGRLTVSLDRRGLWQAGRAWPWDRVTGVRATVRRGRLEPERLEILVPGQVLVITRELTGTASIRSLRNLAQIIEAIMAAGGEAEPPAKVPLAQE